MGVEESRRSSVKTDRALDGDGAVVFFMSGVIIETLAAMMWP